MARRRQIRWLERTGATYPIAVPADAGTHPGGDRAIRRWVPAFAGNAEILVSPASPADHKLSSNLRRSGWGQLRLLIMSQGVLPSGSGGMRSRSPIAIAETGRASEEGSNNLP